MVRAGLDDARLREIGARVIESRGVNGTELDNEDATATRAFARQFAKQEVLREEDGVALADKIHRDDLLVPESLIKQYAELGFFGSSIPAGYGGTDMGYLTMVVLTEELSAASLIAGSLLTRCEILSRAILVGGTERQKQEVAAEAGVRRGAGRHRDHRAGYRVGDGGGAVPRDAGERGRTGRATRSTAPRRGRRSRAAPTCWRCSPGPTRSRGAGGCRCSSCRRSGRSTTSSKYRRRTAAC